MREQKQYIQSGNTTDIIVAPSGRVIRYKQNFFGEDDFWEMLADGGFRRGPRKKEAKLTGARYDAQTRWPSDFDPLKRGAVLVR